MTIRETLFENFAADLEYHPRRGALYLCLGFAAGCFWFFTPFHSKLDVVPAVFGFGSLMLFCKGVFLLRKSSEGLGMTFQEVEKLSRKAGGRKLPMIAAQAGQVLQDFGLGPFLLWPMMTVAHNVDHSISKPPILTVAIVGACLILCGWFIRWLTHRQDIAAKQK